MTAQRPGYWDVKAACWRGAEPTYVMPPEQGGTDESGSAPDPAADGVPSQRTAGSFQHH